MQLVPISCVQDFALVLRAAGCHHVHGVTCSYSLSSSGLLEHPWNLARGKVAQQVREGRGILQRAGRALRTP